MTDLDKLIHDALTLSMTALRRTRHVDQGHSEAEIAVEGALAALKSSAQAAGDWSVPTSHVDRFSQALTLLCGKTPPADAIEAWLTPGSDDARLQEFAVENGPAWAQGIAVIDAAHLLAGMPTEGVDHEIIEVDSSAGWDLKHGLGIELDSQTISDLLRFEETCMDNEDYDVPKERMQHLARMGLVSKVSGRVYELTYFGRVVAQKSARSSESFSNQNG